MAEGMKVPTFCKNFLSNGFCDGMNCKSIDGTEKEKDALIKTGFLSKTHADFWNRSLEYQKEIESRIKHYCGDYLQSKCFRREEYKQMHVELRNIPDDDMRNFKIEQTLAEWRCSFVVIIMAVYWTVEPVPLPVTALIPVVLFPLLGLSTTEEACAPYLQATNMLFMASLTIAIAVECSNLHKRIAYKILMTIGTDIRWLIAGFMLTAMFLGIWIINTAATAMLLPIADVIVEEVFVRNDVPKNKENMSLNLLKQANHEELPNTDKEVVIFSKKKKNSGSVYVDVRLENRRNERLRRILYLSIAYSATIGGTTTLTSNGPNLVLRWILDDIYQGLPEVDYTKWFLFCILATFVTVAIVWYIFKSMFMREEHIVDCIKAPKHLIAKKYDELGPITFHEVAVCFLFILLILLWMFRDPQYLPGWARLVDNVKPKDATAAILIVVLLFMIPAKPLGPFPSPALLNWPMVQSKLAWGVILLRGGGFSMADAAGRSGLSKSIGTQLTRLNVLSLNGIVISTAVLASFITEFASNSAVATLLLPIAAQLASNLKVNPLNLLVPITLACSFAFVLPVGTPANALVFEHAKLSPSDLLIPGLVAKVTSLVVMFINLNLWGTRIFDLDSFPEWAVTATNATRIR